MVYSRLRWPLGHQSHQVEQINRVLALILSKLSDHDYGKMWPKVISEIEFGINNVIHKATGGSPSKLLFSADQMEKVNNEIREFLESEINIKARDLEELRAKASL